MPDQTNEELVRDEAFREFVRTTTRHQPTPGAIEDIENIRHRARVLGMDIIDAAPPCRSRSLALTHLEDAVMRAVQAIVIHRNTETETI